VRFVLKRDRRSKTLRFAPLASDVGGAIVERHPELRDIDSAVWFEKGATPSGDVVLVRSSAALRVARYLGGVCGVLAAAGGLVPRGWRDALYDAVARRRGRLAPACELPTEAERERFVG
jgi:predicted DCC family thiol-disulfide oxidoreductase YuxK